MPINTSSPAFKSVCSYIARIPKNTDGKHGIAWRLDPSGIALMVQQIISMGNTFAATNAIGEKTGVSAQSLRLFCRGLSTSNQPWSELRVAMTAIGASWLRTKSDCGTTQKLPKDPVAVVATQPALPAPVAVPPANLAVTADGAVVAATPPKAITQPSPMAAKPGAYATSSTRPAANAVPPATFTHKSNAANITDSKFAIDPESQDILVTTVTRLRYGTPDHKAKMREVLLQLGTKRA